MVRRITIDSIGIGAAVMPFARWVDEVGPMAKVTPVPLRSRTFRSASFGPHQSAQSSVIRTELRDVRHPRKNRNSAARNRLTAYESIIRTGKN
jgi:hypothetical protein